MLQIVEHLLWPSMSQLGQQRRFGPAPTMPGSPLTAGIVASIGDGREGPQAETKNLLT